MKFKLSLTSNRINAGIDFETAFSQLRQPLPNSTVIDTNHFGSNLMNSFDVIVLLALNGIKRNFLENEMPFKND